MEFARWREWSSVEVVTALHAGPALPTSPAEPVHCRSRQEPAAPNTSFHDPVLGMVWKPVVQGTSLILQGAKLRPEHPGSHNRCGLMTPSPVSFPQGPVPKGARCRHCSHFQSLQNLPPLPF